jgi:hypothetical protein
VKTVQLNETGAFNIFPNPAGSYAVLGFASLAEEGELTITDFKGNLVHKELLARNTSSYRLNTSRLPAGTYLVRLQSGSTAVVRRLVVAN